MTFQWPLALLALLLVPVAASRYVLLERRRRAGDAAQFASPAIFPNVVGAAPGRLRHLPVAILLLAVAVLVTGFARPHADAVRSRGTRRRSCWPSTSPAR